MLVEEGTAFRPDKRMREYLERAEIEAPGCVPRPEVYARLLAVYLYEEDLCSAKFLWKRIPETVKNDGGEELAGLWDIGKALWTRDLPAVYAAIDARQWSSNVSAIVTAIKDRVRERAIELVGEAYTSIKVSDFAQMVGCPATTDSAQEGAAELARSVGWTVTDEGMVCPVRKVAPVAPSLAAEQQLDKLTDFVAFLEK